MIASREEEVIIVGTAFVCDNDTFIYIYKMEKRRAGRSWHNSYLFHVKVKNMNTDNLKRVSNRLLDKLSKNLRSGDIVCRWHDHHFVLILYNIDNSDIAWVKDRIFNNCFESNFKSVEIEMDYRQLA